MRTTLLLIALAALTATATFTQNSMPACDGVMTVVRLSTIKPGGTMKGFMDAVAAHQAWYRANGITDNQIVTARIIVRDKATGALSYSDTEILSYHFGLPDRSRTPNRGDAAWNAYVKQYRDNSEIKNEYLTCMPKPPR